MGHGVILAFQGRVARFWQLGIEGHVQGKQEERCSLSPPPATHGSGGGGEVYQKFLLSSELRNFKLLWEEETGEAFEGPGRTLFLSTRCKCLTLPKREQCCCKIHTQQEMYIHALHGDGRSATATAKEEGRTPRMHMFTDGCAKQYKGKREFRFVARSSRELGFLLLHYFAASSHFKGCHDGFGGISKNAMRKAEKHEILLNVCVCFLLIHSGHQVRWTYQPGSHGRKVTQDFSSTLRCMP